MVCLLWDDMKDRLESFDSESKLKYTWDDFKRASQIYNVNKLTLLHLEKTLTVVEITVINVKIAKGPLYTEYTQAKVTCEVSRTSFI